MIGTTKTQNRTNSQTVEIGPAIHPDCPFCGADKMETVCEDPRIDRCQVCGQAFRQEIDRTIIDGYRRKPAMPSWPESRGAARHHYDFIKKHIGFDNITSILEIGSGDGTLLRMIRRKQPQLEISAVEPSVYHSRRLRTIPETDIIEDYVENIDFDRRFDLVIMSHVLEHIARPLETLKYIGDNLLTEKGYLYIDIPNQDYELQNPDMAAKAPAGHLYFFSGRDLAELLSLASYDKKTVQGAIYRTLPPFYGPIITMISRLERTRGGKLPAFGLKAFNKISLLAALTIRNLLFRRHAEIPLEAGDYRFNNIALVARK